MKRIAAFASAAFVLAVTVPATAHAQHLNYPVSAPAQAGGISNYTTYFNQLGGLDGMAVSWTTSAAGGCALGCSGTFGDLGGGIYGVVGTDFSLKTLGFDDTYGIVDPYQWQLSGRYLTEFAIDPTPASAVFDVVNAPTIDTPNSSFGRPFQWGGCILIFCGPASDQWNTQVYYTNPVGIAGADPVGDLFAGMMVTFGSNSHPTTFGGRRSETAYFSQDLDMVDSRGVILGGDVTPEPATMSMMAFGLVGMAGMARRRRRKV